MHKVTLSVLFLTFLSFPGSAPAQSQADLGRVTLQLRWEYEFQFAGFIAAKELGFYQEAGLEVELREGIGSPRTLQVPEASGRMWARWV